MCLRLLRLISVSWMLSSFRSSLRSVHYFTMVCRHNVDNSLRSPLLSLLYSWILNVLFWSASIHSGRQPSTNPGCCGIDPHEVTQKRGTRGTRVHSFLCTKTGPWSTLTATQRPGDSSGSFRGGRTQTLLNLTGTSACYPGAPEAD